MGKGKALVVAATLLGTATSLRNQPTRDGPKSRWVREPRVYRLDDLLQKHIDTGSFVKSSLAVGPSETRTIFTYPSEQDRWVSGSIQNSSHWENAWTNDLCNYFKKHGKGNFLDVGANLGVYALTVSSCIPQGAEVLAVEGMPDIANHFGASIAANGLTNVALVPYAVSSTDAPDQLTMGLDTDNKGGSALTGNKDATNGDTEIVPVQVTTLDEVLKMEPGMRNLLAMKMDIEGSEGLGLAGSQELLSCCAPCYLLIELCPVWLAKTSVDLPMVIGMLKKAGYVTDSIRTDFEYAMTYMLEQRDLGACTARVQ